MVVESSLIISTREESASLRSVHANPFPSLLVASYSPMLQKHFKQKNLIILRACNELLRRLSRAEDTVFCGRVFIFLFQSFPLGDRSSVNLRGEYHVENVTIYEELPPKYEAALEDEMDIDKENGIKEIEDGTTRAGQKPATEQEDQNGALQKKVKFDAQEEKPRESAPDMDTLYPVFWSLQGNFSTPTRLFEESDLQSFRSGLEATMHKFREVHQELQARGTSKIPDENKRGLKRKRVGQEDELSSSFNPKYLTSRDLFDLEVRIIDLASEVPSIDNHKISDLAFRRHILVQALILLDFLLSLTPKAKKKLEHTSNKSVLYSYTLNEENVCHIIPLLIGFMMTNYNRPNGRLPCGTT